MRVAVHLLPPGNNSQRSPKKPAVANAAAVEAVAVAFKTAIVDLAAKAVRAAQDLAAPAARVNVPMVPADLVRIVGLVPKAVAVPKAADSTAIAVAADVLEIVAKNAANFPRSHPSMLISFPKTRVSNRSRAKSN